MSTFYSSVLFFHVSLPSHWYQQFSCFLSFLPFFLPLLLYSPPLLLLLFSAFLLPSFISSPSLPSFPTLWHSLFPLRCTHLCDRLLLTHSTSVALQMRAGRAKGRVPCRAERTGLNEASLNEFTAFHRTPHPPPSCGLAPWPLSHKAPPLGSDTCLSDTPVISCHYWAK